MLPDPSVSQRHASIRQRGADYIVLDEGSTNGTFVGPVKLSPGAPRVLKDGDLIRVGRIWLQVSMKHAPPSENAADLTRQIALGLVAGALEQEGQPSCPRALVVGGPDEGAELLLIKFGKQYVIGRQKSADLLLTDEDVSRRHLQLERRGARVVVQELGSKNGATLDGELIEKESVWVPGQELGLGNTRLQLRDPLTQTLHEINAAADERIDDSVEPPNVDPADDDASPKSRKPGRSSGPISEAPSRRAESSRGAASVAKPPVRGSSPPAAKGMWGATDVLIALLALLVLGLSAAGLAWLFAH